MRRCVYTMLVCPWETPAYKQTYVLILIKIDFKLCFQTYLLTDFC